MSDDGQCYAATPAASLEEHILNPNIAKSETEWWAHREILRLRAQLLDERERCAKIADSGMLPCGIGGDLILDRCTADTIAAEIRRGE